MTHLSLVERRGQNPCDREALKVLLGRRAREAQARESSEVPESSEAPAEPEAVE